MSNQIKKDRYHPTSYQAQMKMVRQDENTVYFMLNTSCIQDGSDMDTGCIQDGSDMDTQSRLVQVSSGELSPGEVNSGEGKEGEGSAREGEERSQHLFTPEQYAKLQEMFNPGYLDHGIVVYAKQASAHANHFEAFVEFAKTQPSLRKKS